MASKIIKRNCKKCNKEFVTCSTNVWHCSIRCRFWDKVTILSLLDCWKWNGYKNINGYGRFALFGKFEYANRVAWALTFHELPMGLDVLHKCDNPNCVNPYHLFLGTHLDNMKDMMNKKRNGYKGSPGELNGKSKLLEKDVILIKQLLKKGQSERKIAKQFNISRTAIWLIRAHKTWKHIT